LTCAPLVSGTGELIRTGNWRAGGPPPFFVAHGDLNTIVPVDDARRFVRSLRSSSENPIVYAELSGAHHSFDLFHSIRSADL